MSTPRFVAGVDAGASKTAMRLETWSGEHNWCERLGPGSLSHDTATAIDTVAGGLSTLLSRAGADAAEVAVTIGIAGYGHATRVSALQQRLGSSWGSLLLTSDARISLYGATHGEPGVVLALGTGSVAMRLDASGEHHVGGWGFPVGDDGGGAQIGRLALGACLEELDRCGAPRSALAMALCERVGSERGEILGWLSAAGPRDYATLATPVLELAERCDRARGVMRRAVADIRHLAELALDGQNLPLYLLGSVGLAVPPFLPPDLVMRLRTPQGDALDGACLLARRQANASETP